MTLPAARIADQTAHLLPTTPPTTGVISTGAPRVLIGSMPAARVGDLHVCPLHGGGPLSFGSINVFVAGPLQCRVSDPCVCPGAPDMVALGHLKTLVGMSGAFAGGLGGVIGLLAGGYLAGIQNFLGYQPRAVLDDSQDAGYFTQYCEGIRIEGSPEFQARVIQDLDTIAGTKAGDIVLGRIAESGRMAVIRETTGGNMCYTNSNGMLNNEGANGTGADSLIAYNPLRTVIDDGSEDWMTRPPDVGLFHELRHAADASEGVMIPGESVIDGRSTKNGDAQAVGIGDYAGKPGTENAYRAQRGEPDRPRY